MTTGHPFSGGAVPAASGTDTQSHLELSVKLWALVAFTSRQCVVLAIGDSHAGATKLSVVSLDRLATTRTGRTEIAVDTVNISLCLYGVV